MNDETDKTINIILAALGGEGGGVFTSWLAEAAALNGWQSQSTSLAGVAQRTGATIYYLELFPKRIGDDRKPVMSLFPAQGDIDLAITSEIAEAGRMLQRGFINPKKTTLITSSHRVFGITEKSHLTDGRMDKGVVISMAEQYSKRLIQFDMMAIAEKHDSIISSALLGALAGSKALPFDKESFITVVTRTGKSLKNNLAAFEESFINASEPTSAKVNFFEPSESSSEELGGKIKSDFVLPPPKTAAGKRLLHRLQKDVPDALHEMIYSALQRLVEYQDARYAHEYLDALKDLFVSPEVKESHTLSEATARYLALWMCYEDIPRVAQLKVRKSRMEEIRKEVKAAPDQILHVTEYFRPRPEEVCAILPRILGKTLLNSSLGYRIINFFTGEKKLRTDKVIVNMLLRLLSTLRFIRRFSYGHAIESHAMNRWLGCVKKFSKRNIEVSIELAQCGAIIKGYGPTRERTLMQVQKILDLCESSSISKQQISELRRSCAEDDNNMKFNQTIEAIRLQTATTV